MDAPHISTLPQDSTPPPVESQYSLMGRFRLNNPPPPPESSSLVPGDEVFVIEDDEEDQLIDDDDDDLAAVRPGGKPRQADTSVIVENEPSSAPPPPPQVATPKSRNKGARKPGPAAPPSASGASINAGNSSPAPRKGGRKSKVTSEPEKAAVQSNPSIQDSPQANSAMMSAWRLEVAPPPAVVSPKTEAGPSEQTKPQPRKRKRTTKASEAPPGDNLSAVPPTKRRSKTSKYIVKEEDGEFPSTFVYQGFPNQIEGDEVLTTSLTVPQSRPRQPLPSHLRSEAYDSASSTPLPPSLAERDRENPSLSLSLRPQLLHVERFLLPASFTNGDAEKIPSEFLTSAPLRLPPLFPPAIQAGQFSCWNPYTGPLEKTGKKCRRWMPVRREFKTIGGGSWCTKTWIGGKETEVEKIIPPPPSVDLQIKTSNSTIEATETGSVVGSTKGGGRGGSRGGKGGGRGGRTAVPQDGTTAVKKSRSRPSKKAMAASNLPMSGATNPTPVQDPPSTLSVSHSQVGVPPGASDNGMADAALELEMMG